MIFKLETNLGRAHTVSPFPQLYSKYGFSTVNTNGPIQEEKKVEEVKVKPVAEKQAAEPQPKQEAKVPVEGGDKKPKQPKVQPPKAPV